MFFVTNFPAAFTNDTFQEEKRFGSNIKVKWIDDTSCLVILQVRERERERERGKKERKEK